MSWVVWPIVQNKRNVSCFNLHIWQKNTFKRPTNCKNTCWLCQSVSQLSCWLIVSSPVCICDLMHAGFLFMVSPVCDCLLLPHTVCRHNVTASACVCVCTCGYKLYVNEWMNEWTNEWAVVFCIGMLLAFRASEGSFKFQTHILCMHELCVACV